MKVNTLFKILIALQFICVDVHAQIHHVEPLNWWVDMKNPALQLLINGENIGETTPVINYPGVTIQKINKGDSKNYLFIDLLIGKIARPGILTISFRKDGKEVYSYRYDLLKRAEDGGRFQGFNASDAMYLLVPDRFANGDPGNDKVEGMKEQTIDRSLPGSRHGGDIRGIINNLDYIKEMGFTAIWPTPMLENDMPAYSYHGYAITNHYKVDPRYGTLDDYKELAVKAKQKGLKLVFDEVLNHTGNNYWWMVDLPFRDWISYAPPHAYVGTNHRRTVNQDMYASEYDKDLWSNGWFDKTMPDMNGKNPFMATYLTQNTIWWIETLQLSGIRQDTYGYSDKTFLKNWSCAIMQEYPKISLMGEEWSYNPLITSYWQTGKKNLDGYTSCLNTIMDFPLQDALVKSLTGKEDASYNEPFTKIYEMIANDFVYANPNQMLVMGDNHDMDRLFTQLNQDVALTQMALTFILTIRGIPQIFYGTEILMDNTGHHKVDGLIRADFPGGWKGDTVNAFTGTGLNNNQSGIQSYVKKLLGWRKDNAVIASGKTLHFAPFKGIYTYFRYNKEKTVMVIMNINDVVTSIDTDRFAEILKGKTTAVNVASEQTIDIKRNISISPKSAVVLEIK